MTQLLSDGRVEFRFYRPDASQVRIAGDFSNWEPKLAMDPAAKGWWLLQVLIPPGEYRFRYEIDGRWFTDFTAQGFEPSPYGLNSILVVPG